MSFSTSACFIFLSYLPNSNGENQCYFLCFTVWILRLKMCKTRKQEFNILVVRCLLNHFFCTSSNSLRSNLVVLLLVASLPGLNLISVKIQNYSGLIQINVIKKKEKKKRKEIEQQPQKINKIKMCANVWWCCKKRTTNLWGRAFPRSGLNQDKIWTTLQKRKFWIQNINFK